jgi:hypothetical protein
METGKVDVTDFTIAHDAGVPLHPVSVESQNEEDGPGARTGHLRGVCSWTMERRGTAPCSTTRCPLHRCAPHKVIDIITDDPDGPFGAKERRKGAT